MPLNLVADAGFPSQLSSVTPSSFLLGQNPRVSNSR